MKAIVNGSEEYYIKRADIKLDGSLEVMFDAYIPLGACVETEINGTKYAGTNNQHNRYTHCKLWPAKERKSWRKKLFG